MLGYYICMLNVDAVSRGMTTECTSTADEPCWDTASLEVVERELTTLAGHLNAGNYRFLRLLAEFERRDGHAGWGIASCAHWLSWKCGIGLVAAREKLRVARALVALPMISDAMQQGKLSYCKVRALTRVATPETEALLVDISEHCTVSHVEKIVRLYQRTDRAEELSAANACYAARNAQCYFDEGGQVIVRARLAPEQGALFMKALEAASDALREAEDASRGAPEATQATSAEPEPAHARKADALALLAETFLARGPNTSTAADRHVVTVHIDERVLREPQAEGECNLEETVAVPPATVRRLCCEGSLVALVEDDAGSPRSASRKTRVVSPAMRRALNARDGGCRFPGCSNARYTDAHHIVHWIDGGETTLTNLTLLCRKHHRFVHEYGFTIERVGRALRFVRPDGRHVPDVPIVTPCASAEGCAALHQAHRERKLEISADTAVPRWRGEAPQYALILEGLCRPTGHPDETLHVECADETLRDGEDLELEWAIHASRQAQPRSSETAHAWTTQSHMRAIVNRLMSELPSPGANQ